MKSTRTLKKNYEFNRVYRRGKYLHGKSLTLYYRKRNDRRNFVGITVSRKVRGSVSRNRVKRILREVYRLNEALVEPGYDIILLGRKIPEQFEFKVAQSDFRKLVAGAGIQVTDSAITETVKK